MLGERYRAEVVDAFSQTGSGSLPTSTIPSAAIAIGPANNGADIARGQQWLDHVSPATTGLYDHRRSKPEDSPTFWVRV